MMSDKVYLGGTTNTVWRDELISLLTIAYFNPMVPDWTEAARKQEALEKKSCNIHLYVITREMTGVFSIAEAVDSVHEAGVKTIFQVMPTEGFSEGQKRSLVAVAELIGRHDGGYIHFDSRMDGTARMLNEAGEILK